MTERISKIEESLNEKIRERDEAAKKVNPIGDPAAKLTEGDMCMCIYTGCVLPFAYPCGSCVSKSRPRSVPLFA